MRFIRVFWADERAATAVEYGLIIAVLSLVVVAGIGLASDQIEFMFSHQDSELRKAFNGGSQPE